MLVASDKTHERKSAWLVDRSDGPFYCPECSEEVVLKKGKIKIPHFAHRACVDCVYSVNESQKHLMVKRAIYESLKTRLGCTKCELERSLNGVRPDISLYINNIPVAIEVQNSSISINEIYRRTKQYALLGVYLLWVLPTRSPKTFLHNTAGVNVYRIKEWEKYLHAMYFGQLYYWVENAVVCPFRFNKFELWVNEYYNQYEDAVMGGYYRKAKSLKIPFSYNEIDIVNNFAPIIRQEWKSKNWIIPNAKLWIGKLSNV